MRSIDVDPLAEALAPPQNESPEQRHHRVFKERTAKKASDEIDDQLSRERQQAKRQPKPVKILLLGAWRILFGERTTVADWNDALRLIGQSESGEKSVRRAFRLNHTAPSREIHHSEKYAGWLRCGSG